MANVSSTTGRNLGRGGEYDYSGVCCEEWKTLNVVFVCHGQSKLDQPYFQDFWIGKTDSPLTPLGVIQADEVAKVFHKAGFLFAHVYSSPTASARSTASQILSQTSLLNRLHNNTIGSGSGCSSSSLAIKVYPVLEEQNFGIAEGRPVHKGDVQSGSTLDDLFKRGQFPPLASHQRFPTGESEKDLEKRANEALKMCVYPHLEEDGVTVAIVSHKRLIAKMVKYLVNLPHPPRWSNSWYEMENTAWTHLEISVAKRCDPPTNRIPYETIKIVIKNVNQNAHIMGLEAPPLPLALATVPETSKLMSASGAHDSDPDSDPDMGKPKQKAKSVSEGFLNWLISDVLFCRPKYDKLPTFPMSKEDRSMYGDGNL